MSLGLIAHHALNRIVANGINISSKKTKCIVFVIYTAKNEDSVSGGLRQDVEITFRMQ